MSDKQAAIHGAMGAILKDVEAITKSRENKQQGFNYRGIDDAYNSLHGVMANHGVFTVPRVLDRERTERTSKAGGILAFTVLNVEYDFVSSADGSTIKAGPVVGEGMDSGDKSSNKALAAAHKYVLFQTFLIPTMFKDPDAEALELAGMEPISKKEAAALRDSLEAAGGDEVAFCQWLKVSSLEEISAQALPEAKRAIERKAEHG